MAALVAARHNPFLRAYKDDPRFIAFAKDRSDGESRRQALSTKP